MYTNPTNDHANGPIIAPPAMAIALPAPDVTTAALLAPFNNKAEV